ncbi:MAG: PolC-type DNA polymerase III [Bacillus thermozeamaize]|uniref:DNA polymerase III PolC-type n=1 Tax=Bacillus thermozeamaize TaxID=230954 RepID=A0A1Y3PQH6_9BACI|nr:MAG: PolC-type DNA polymerase III [Bacillus thermozeamaize]
MAAGGIAKPLAVLFEQTVIPESQWAYFSKAQVEKVEVYPEQREWVIQLRLPEMVPAVVFEQVTTQIARKLSGMVRVTFRCRHDRLDLDHFLREYWTYLIARLSLPAHVHQWLREATWRLEEQRLCLQVTQPLMYELLEKKNLLQMLRQLILDMTGIPLQVKVEYQDDLQRRQQLEEQRRTEEQMLIQQAQQALAEARAQSEPETGPGELLYGSRISSPPTPLHEVREEEQNLTIQGEVFATEWRELKNGKKLLLLSVTDYTDSIQVKVFVRDKEDEALLNRIEKGTWLKIRGHAQVDFYSRELTLVASDLHGIPPQVRQDLAEEKRVELHAHTSMSAMDGVVDVANLVKQAAEWGHPAIAITDHGVVQSFPDAYEAGKKYGVKILYGMEAYVVDDGVPIVWQPEDRQLAEATYVIFDTETTGLSANYHELIEIGAVKMKNGQVIDRYETFVKPNEPISPAITRLTGITNEMVSDAPDLKTALSGFRDFCKGAILAAHNARFDLGFINAAYKKLGWPAISEPVVDTLELARFLYPRLKNHRLNTLCETFQIPLSHHHRAYHDAEATGQLLWRMIQDLLQKGILSLAQLNHQGNGTEWKKSRPFHVSLLVQNQTGLKNLYRLVSLSHLEYFHRVPRIPKRLLMQMREGLLVGSACQRGELFETLLQKSLEEAEEVAQFYDYLEIQPLDQLIPLIERGVVQDEENLRDLHRKIVAIGEKLGKPVVATGDLHYLHPHDAIFRKILTAGKVSADELTPAYFRTTEEMMECFSHLGADKAKEVVVEWPKQVAAMIEPLKPFPDDLHTPVIEGADQAIRQMSYEKARQIYGDPLPEIVQQRLEKELESIIGNGFAVIYYIAHKLVAHSLKNGYLVGSRGSVGSSLVATMTEITEVNPLPPHYVCLSCHYHQFFTDGSVGSGFDLPDADCPRCGKKLHKDGHDIPFETFMGFEGDKVPDIDLNFSGEYQPRAHKYTEELFGKDYVFRAGTISTVAEKTAYGFVRKYLEENNLQLRSVEVERLVAGCTGIKRTTGQHPGGLMVIPQYMEVYDFTPLQRPADDVASDTVTTHFDYHAISGRLLKLDILGHDDPTVIRMLQDLTGVDPKKIPVDDPKVLSLFYSTEALGVTPEQIRSNTGTLGIPEFGTRFVRQMLEETRPTTFAELVRISGLSHGTDVWINNAQEVIRSGKAVLAEVISTRDDIMVYLIHRGLNPSQAFKIMERVRKGKGLTDEDIQVMKEHHVPDWYIESCQKIKYMFPKAHAVAYVLMALRIAWFKVYRPIEFYATYFTVRADDFDMQLALQGPDAIMLKMDEIQEKGNQASPKEKSLLVVMELALEMLQRGFRFQKVDLQRSDAVRFLIDGNTLIPPFRALSGIGESAARSIVRAREEQPFLSVEDFQERTRVSRTVTEQLAEMGCFDELPESNQLSLF